jgi:ABC-2 type transport system permease protein
VLTDFSQRDSAAAGSALVVMQRTARNASRSGVVWGYVFGITVASAAFGFTSTYKTPGARAKFAALFSSNTALAAINGPAVQIQSVPGYTVWKSLMFLAIVGAVWGLLLATRHLRGEEDAGRWELLLAGRTTRRSSTAQALAGLGAGVVALWAVTALIIVVVGRSSKVKIPVLPGLFFAVTLVAAAAVFVAAGALTSQLAASRRQASAYAGVALGVCYALRLVADSSHSLEWLRWTTPLGWVEQIHPLTGPRPWILVPIVALIAVLGGLAILFSGRRDLGGSVVPDRVVSRPHTRLLSGPVGLAWRLLRPSILGWAVAIGVTGLLMGLIAKQGGVALTSSTSVRNVMARLGIHGSGATQYLGFTFVIVAVLVAFVGAGQATSARSEEAGGNLDHLLARPVSRRRWLVGRSVLAAVVLCLSGIIAGLSAWLGAASQNAGVTIASLLGAGLNVSAPALCIFGLAACALGVLPRLTSAVAYGLLAWSFVIELLAGAFGSSHWLVDTSVFHQMTSAPSVPPNWTSAGALVGVGVAGVVGGTLAFGRRDTVGE